jgi:purine-binding chemotaxis protein CheW
MSGAEDAGRAAGLSAFDDWLAGSELAAEPGVPAPGPAGGAVASALPAQAPPDASAGAGAPASLLEAVSALETESPEADAPSAVRPEGAAEDRVRYVLFRVADAHYAVQQEFVTELDRVPRITVVPNVPAWIRGITNRRGDILSVVDTRTLLGLERLGAGNGRVLVVRLLDDTCSLGLLVDDVLQILEVSREEVRAPGSGLEGMLAPYLTGLFALEERTVAVLDLDRLLRSPLIRQFDEPAEATTG